jgi:protein required for attachment to host cells
MIEDKRTLVVLADGRRVRLLEEARRGGALKERAGWLKTMPPFHHPGAAQRVTVHARVGSATHASHEPPRDKGERRFLSDLAEHLEPVMREQGFDDLVIMAPPRALGILRKALSPGLQRRLVATDAHDRVDAAPEEIHEQLRAARMRLDV